MQSAAAAPEGASNSVGNESDLRYSSASALSPPDSSLEDLEEYEDLEVSEVGEEEEETGIMDGSDGSGSGAVRKPHFLDYDNKPPVGLEDQVVFVGQSRRRRSNGRTVEGGDGLPKEEIISQSVVSEGEIGLGAARKDVGRGTWPSASSGGTAASGTASTISDALRFECVYSLFSMLGSTNSLERSTKLMQLSKNRETCSALRCSIPLLVQIIHNDPNETARRNARQALTNVICCHPDDKAGRREVRVLKPIEQLIDYADLLRDYGEESPLEVRDVVEDPEKHPIQSITTLMKISFDEEHRHAMCQLGALQTISTLIQLDHAVHGPNPTASKCVTMRRYAGMILTNLTFGDGNNKSLLCSNKCFMRALVAQIQSTSDELVQVTASVLRNLSWRADGTIKQTLSEIGTVKVLTRAAMICTIENTLKAILSALWNLSNHCPPNRSEFCEVEGSLEFLIDMLSYEAPSKTMSVIENAGGILRNISSHIAVREDYRKILRKKNCLKILLEQLKSPSLTVVSNACGTLGNLSGENYEDQKFLRENGAIPMLRSLIYSKHKMISNGSSMALKNLLKPPASAVSASASLPIAIQQKSTPAVVNGSADSKELPSLNARKKKALEQELDGQFLPPKGGLRSDEKDVCTGRRSTTLPDDEEQEVVNHDAVHIRLVEQSGQMQEEDSERPVNYSLKEEETVYQDYQETDIDQITDYSLRYAENQSEESEDEKVENYRQSSNRANGILMAEDSVKCYYTEGTPQIISSATSMSDLRLQLMTGGMTPASATVASPKAEEEDAPAKEAPIPMINGGKPESQTAAAAAGAAIVATGDDTGDTGCNTPDRPYNYCEEGTPDFSRDASLNALELNGGERNRNRSSKPPELGDPPDQTVPTTPGSVGGGGGGDGDGGAAGSSIIAGGGGKQVSFLNTAEETPLMFSRTSSVGSLSSAEPAVCIDDKSSIISEFSRLASGVMSPSELPDSPTQSMPHSPRRTAGDGAIMAPTVVTVVAQNRPPLPGGFDGHTEQRPPAGGGAAKSAFEDSVSKFNVENTPAAFSCATSLSNLSMEEKEDQESKLISRQAPPEGPPVLPVPEVCNETEHSDTDSDDDADAEDDLLLESCINMGMSSSRMARSSDYQTPRELPEDSLQRFCTEDTPARLSKATSNCDLSVLSMGTEEHGHDSDESSSNCEQDDELLDECIRSGMSQSRKKDSPVPLAMGAVPKTNGNQSTTKENPMSMMRNPVHMEPIYANDEVTKFYVEDSLCAMSTMSGLSDLTVATEATGGAQKVVRISTLKGKPLSQLPPPPVPLGEAVLNNGSLSSISVESDDQLVDEAIAAGIKFTTNKAKHNASTFKHVHSMLQSGNRMTAAAVNLNYSTDSDDSNDPQSNSLLDECIETGMKKLTEKHKEDGFELRAGMNFTELGMRTAAAAAAAARIPPSDDSIPDSDRDHDLVLECIKSGLPKGKASQQLALELTQNLQRLSISGAGATKPVHAKHVSTSSGSKNVHTTPVNTKDAGATNVMSAGVVANTAAGGSSFSINTAADRPGRDVTAVITSSTTPPISSPTAIITTTTIPATTTNSSSSIISSHQLTTSRTIATRNEPVPPYQRQPLSPCQPTQQQQQLRQPQPLASSTTTLVQSGYESLLERSNEFPAAPFAASSDATTLSGIMMASSGMQISNEFMVDASIASDCGPQDKHKDPDLMLKSVERLTQELVSTAEYLRTVSSGAGGTGSSAMVTSDCRETNSTWDEDATCSNDVSFPSLSVQAPKIHHSVTDDTDDTATISDEVDSKALDALEEQTPINENRSLPGEELLAAAAAAATQEEIRFQLGGEVQHPMVGGGGHSTFGPTTTTGTGTTGDGCSFSTVSTLTNSTIIAMEATKVAAQLQDLAIVESADIDLSKINPPFFGSESILISDCSDSEMTFRHDSISKERKISLPSGLVAKRALGHAFNDSLNSLHNLDSIGPPSLMDELMDSMISVASITSEVVDVDSGNAGTVSAASDQNFSSGHSSLTWNSSLENLIKFSPTVNAGPGATPGGKSTPMSPKRAERRQAMKDRYKTYTIPNGKLVDLNQAVEDAVGTEVKTPTPSAPSTPSPKKSSKERRQENKSRYETQVINASILPLLNGEERPRTPLSSIIATPVVFSPITLHSPAPMSLERIVTPEPVHPLHDDEEPLTYTIEESCRRASFEQKLPTIPAAAAPETVANVSNKQTPLSSPSKVPTPTKVAGKVNPSPVADPSKVVRGTKKPAYVSPYRRQVVSAPVNSTRTSTATASQLASASKKEPAAVASQPPPKLKAQTSLVESRSRPQPLKARTSVGSKRNSLEMNGNGSVRGADLPKIRDRQSSCGAFQGNSKASKPQTPVATEPHLIRQGTFTQDEPTNPEVPIVTSAPSTPAKTLRRPGSMIPSSASSSRLTAMAAGKVSRISLHKSVSMDASKTVPGTPTSGPGTTPSSGESTPLSSRFRLTTARTSLVDYKKPCTGRLSTPISSNSSQEQIASLNGAVTSPGSLIPMRRKSGLVLPKRTNLTMKSNPDVLKGKLDGVRNAFARTALKTGTR
ncbi:adenomatous polyposis coli homolog [Sabethes cyaneus]|uniref:adenomatous polyposis coli homolog n=1 Tax=Sabethes cyaneus TaxID=53552 RepID=UPI00237D996B|nr:adenomatous polyposis coli homolog [Sabethes cyaneus]